MRVPYVIYHARQIPRPHPQPAPPHYAAIRIVLGGEFSDVWVAGEVSGLKMATSGHAYFNLKDVGAQIKCACFRGALRLMKFQLNRVKRLGSVSIFLTGLTLFCNRSGIAILNRSIRQTSPRRTPVTTMPAR